jgi:hypothetical protein
MDPHDGVDLCTYLNGSPLSNVRSAGSGVAGPRASQSNGWLFFLSAFLLNCGCFETKSFSTKIHEENSWFQTERTIDEYLNSI